MQNFKEKPYSRITVITVYLAAHAAVLLISIIFKKLFLDSEFSFPCAFLNLFGLYCPGCGGTRALGALLEFNLVKAFLLYPPLIITVGFILYIDILGIVSIIKKTYAPIRSFRGIYTVIIPISIMLFFIIRNITLLLGFDLVEFASLL